jgi:hypothetical protein
MFLTLPAGEPEAGPWRSVPAAALLELILTVTGDPSGRPRVVAVDGRGASGKSTLAARLHALTPSSALVHTDDLAWHEPLFEWGHLLAGGVLRPLHEGGRCATAHRSGSGAAEREASRYPLAWMCSSSRGPAPASGNTPT